MPRHGTDAADGLPAGRSTRSGDHCHWADRRAGRIPGVGPADHPLGEEPGFRGYALPLLQTSRPPLQAAAILGVLVSCWHLPLIIFGGLSLIGLPSTFAITFLYVWLFNGTGGSVLLTMLFHISQGTFTVGSYGFTGTDAGRAELIYFVVLLIAALTTVLLDREAWRTAPKAATDVGPLRRRPARFRSHRP